MNNTDASRHASRIDIAAAAAVSVHVAPGASIHCLSGRIWLTQENDPRDYCLAPGLSFAVDRSGRAVLGTFEEPGVVVVRRDAASRACHLRAGMVSIDSLERLTRAARAAQAQYLGALITRILCGPLTLLRRLGYSKGCACGSARSL